MRKSWERAQEYKALPSLLVAKFFFQFCCVKKIKHQENYCTMLCFYTRLDINFTVGCPLIRRKVIFNVERIFKCFFKLFFNGLLLFWNLTWGWDEEKLGDEIGIKLKFNQSLNLKIFVSYSYHHFFHALSPQELKAPETSLIKIATS